jgi:hypothetical protein
MLVTCYYDIYDTPDKFMEYVSSFYELGNSGIPIIVFTDPSLVSSFRNFPDTVKIIGMPLDFFELYSIGMAYHGELPLYRNVKKDTKEFLSLMNTKIECILRASEICEDSTFVWIDFGILKIIKDRSSFLEKLRMVHQHSFSKVLIPGCWSPTSPFYIDSVHWRFCGGLFIIPREHISSFYQHSKHVLTDFCTLPIYKLTWETNVWFIVELNVGKTWIQWYAADHNDSILPSLDVILNL